jgi:hypothetical protein
VGAALSADRTRPARVFRQATKNLWPLPSRAIDSLRPKVRLAGRRRSGPGPHMPTCALQQSRQGEEVVADVAQAAQPTSRPQLGEVHPARRPLLSANQDATPIAMSPLRRQNPREEPGALAARAGICAGGGERSSSLPRPLLASDGSRCDSGMHCASCDRCLVMPHRASLGRRCGLSLALWCPSAGRSKELPPEQWTTILPARTCCPASPLPRAFQV